MAYKEPTYPPCKCGGAVRVKYVIVDTGMKDGLIEYENVPVGVCLQCGMRFYREPVSERQERLARAASR